MDEFETTGLIADTDLQGLSDLLRQAIAALGFDLVRLTRPPGENKTLQIMAERAGGGEIIVADCAAISRAVGGILDEHDPMAGAYMLEVSSPGIDRPLTRRRDFEHWTGFVARCTTVKPVEGATVHEGRIAGIDASGLVLRHETGEIVLPIAQLIEAKLVLNDELLQATRRAAPAA